MPINYDTRHQGPYDRGSADKWYDRPKNPHYYETEDLGSRKIVPPEMTEEQVDAYLVGYDEGVIGKVYD